MSRCFVLQDCNKDVSDATRFGEIVYVFERKNGRSSVWSDDYRKEVLKRFREMRFDRQEDYLVAVGHTAPLVIAIGELLPWYSFLNMLVFYGPEQQYRDVVIGDISEVEDYDE